MSTPIPDEPRLHENRTAQLLQEVATLRVDTRRTVFENRQRIAELLGACHDPNTGFTRFGFWAPELTALRVAERDVFLELFTPIDAIDFTAPRLAVRFRRQRVALRAEGDYWWGVLEGVTAGSRHCAGALYWLMAHDGQGNEHLVRDLLAHSLPYGSMAPAELYDMNSLQRRRQDLAHFASAPAIPTSILELHIPTATAEGTVAALAERFRQIAERQHRGEALSAEDQMYAAYDGIQPLPVDPTIERPTAGASFTVTDVIDDISGIVGVLLIHPDNQNWGYDNMVASSSATNPSLLASRRPDEMIELAEALHAMPQPMMLIFDIVYGHADNQAASVLPSRFFKGPNMYGMDLNHQDLTVRAILLEMQRRRMNTGCDGLRVDGAQDFKYYDPRSGEVEYDDEFLQSMSDVQQHIGDHKRTVWMIFEDGRPWPAEGWETASTYRDVIEKQPDTWQWGPLIFAHNTPMVEGFWSSRFDKVQQIMEHGGHWISGCANHDTVRRGTQVDATLPLNTHLGDNLPGIFDQAYDNPAITLISYGFLPGIPMDFLNATTRTPWGFMRTTDDIYGVKVMAEEAGFLHWQLDDHRYAAGTVFPRVKRHGFDTRARLSEFLNQLQIAIDATDYDLDAIALTLPTPSAMRPGAAGLQLMALDYMRDVHQLCNVGPRLVDLDAVRTEFSFRMRCFRQEHRWLRDDSRPDDTLQKIERDQILYRGNRHSPDGSVEVMLLANMAGSMWTGSVLENTGAHAEAHNIECVLSPAASLVGDTLSLPDSSGIVLVRKHP